MRAWTRAVRDARCGSCGTAVARGTVVLTISRPGWAKVRCPACADEAVPADVEDRLAAGPTRGER